MIGQASLTTQSPQFIAAHFTWAPPQSELTFLPREGAGQPRFARGYRPMRPNRPRVQPQVPQKNATAGELRKTTQAGEEGYVTQTNRQRSTTLAGNDHEVTQTSEERNLTQVDEGTLEKASDANVDWPMVVALMAAGVVSIPFLVLFLFLAKRLDGQSGQKQDEEAQRNARPLLAPQYV